MLAIVVRFILAAAPLFASIAASAAPPFRYVLHVCDCPAVMAGDERSGLLEAFAALGYEQGRNLDLVTHDVESTQGRYPAFLNQVIAKRKPDLILASGLRVARGATEIVDHSPVLFWRLMDPVGEGLVASLSRPGGKLTGFSRAIEKLTAKRLELIHQMLPAARRVAMLYRTDVSSHVRQAAEVKAAATPFGLQVIDHGMPTSRWSVAQLESTFASMRRDGVDAFLVPDQNIYPEDLVRISTTYRLPTVFPLTHNVTDWGGLAAYSTQPHSWQDIASYAVRLLEGVRPGELPVQEPARFELVLNMRAARAFGLSFPRAFLLQATQVIE